MTGNPFINTPERRFDRPADLLISLIPIIVWSVYIFGARVVTLCLLGGGISLGADYLLLRYVFKRKKGSRLDIMASFYGVLACFSMPVTVPLWMPIISSLLVVFAKNLKVYKKRRLFNPFIFSSAVLNIVFPKIMTEFTRPFAYFSAFDITIDKNLINGYRVISPLQYIANGNVYEDGALPEFFGYASGAVGEIAVTAIIISACYLFIKKEASFTNTVAFLFPILVLALIFPSGDAENNFYAYSLLLSGAVFYIALFAINERYTVPMTKLGSLGFSVVSGVAVFIMRKFFGGFEWGYFVILVMNAISPFIEKYTVDKPFNKEKKV